MPLVLVLDTATPAITAGLAEISAESTALLAERVEIDSRAHGELLSPLVQQVLADAGRRVRDLSAIVAGLGPGPFTGLRAGLVTAVAMASALDVPTYGVCTLDALGATTSGRALAATDARRKEVYWASYLDGRRQAGPEVSKPSDVDTSGLDRGVGDGVRLYAEVLGLAAGEPRYPQALELARLAADRVLAQAPSEILIPLYLRRPDAVEPTTRKKALA